LNSWCNCELPANLSAAIDAAAKQNCQSKSEYVRRSVIERLEAKGFFDPAAIGVAHCQSKSEYMKLRD